MSIRPTLEQSQALQEAFDHFNITLFEGHLPKCMVAFSRNANIIAGYYSPEMWEQEGQEGPVRIAEIAINVNIMKHTDLVTFYMTLIHEMLHHWQYSFGSPGTEGYHNKEYASMAHDLGLLLSNGEGGYTGKMITQKLIEGSLVEKAIRSLPDAAIIPWEASELHLPGEGGSGGSSAGPANNEDPMPKPKGTRSKYTCPVCGLNAWAKPGALIMCGTDSRFMIEQS